MAINAALVLLFAWAAWTGGTGILACATDKNACPTYRWQDKEVYRFEYRKSTRLEPAAGSSAAPTLTELAAVLIFEIQSVERGTAAALLRVDSPRLALPPEPSLDMDTGIVTSDAMAARRVGRAIEDLLLETRWKVELKPDGRVRVLSRQPADFRTWVRKLELAGRWPRGFATRCLALLEQSLFLSDGREDDELLPVGTPDVSPLTPRNLRSGISDSGVGEGRVSGSLEAPVPPPVGLEALRPRRQVAAAPDVVGTPGQKAVWKLSRTGPAPGTRIVLPLVAPEKAPVIVTALKTESVSGRAVFDLDLGMLDSAAEEYRVLLACTFGKREQQRAVSVTWQLQRLAPAVR